MTNISIHTPVVEAPKGEVINSEKTWKVNWIVDKWNKTEDYELGKAPDEVMRIADNLLVSGGINLLLLHLIGDTNITAYGSGTANLRVGDSSTAATSGDPDLFGNPNVDSNPMDSGYPTVVQNKVTWRATYGSTEANFTWNEVGVVNNAGTPNLGTIRLLNRKVQNFGTKASGSTWTLTLEILIT